MDYEYYDVFDEGVAPGGLKNRADIKLLVCYIINNVDRPITKTQINEVMLQQSLANYFEVNQAISELLEDGNIVSELVGEDEILQTTEKGRSASEILQKDIPLTVREKAINTATRILLRARRESENKIEIQKLDVGYNVTFTILEKEDELMKLTLYVADSEQAAQIKERFLEDPVALYSVIISTLTA